jgi:hypothetical protein
VRVVDSKTRYYVRAQKGLNQLGVTCECCTPPSEADAALVHVCWQLASTECGSVYDILLQLVMKTKQPPLPVIVLVLRPLVQVLKYYMSDTNSWRVVIRHIERSFSQGDMTTPCQRICVKVFQHVRAVAFPSCNDVTDIVIHLHTLSSWSLAKCVSFDGADQLSIRFMESTLASGRADLVCKFVGDVGLAICAQAPG